MQFIWYNYFEVKNMRDTEYKKIRKKMIEKDLTWEKIRKKIGYSDYGLRLAIKNNNMNIINRVNNIIDEY